MVFSIFELGSFEVNWKVNFQTPVYYGLVGSVSNF
jgi:hypothetical protein